MMIDPILRAIEVRPRVVDKDKNCPGVMKTIVGGTSVRSQTTSSLASSSSKGKYKQVLNVELKQFKVDNISTSTDEDYEGVYTPYQDALVILARIARWKIKPVIIDAKVALTSYSIIIMNRSSMP